MSFASFIRDGKFSASLYSYFSTNINKDLTVVLQPLSLSPIVYFVSFYILPYILPGLECSRVINLIQSLLKVLFDCHLSIKSLTLRSNSCSGVISLIQSFLKVLFDFHLSIPNFNFAFKFQTRVVRELLK